MLWQDELTPFGESSGQIGLLDEDALFTGKALDAETGLYFFNARWYDPTLGRFISEDAIKDGVNWYVYCSNDPLNGIDPTGLAEYNPETGILSFNNYDDINKSTFESLQKNLTGKNIGNLSMVERWGADGKVKGEFRTIKGVEWAGTEWDENGNPKPITTYEDVNQVGARENVPPGIFRAGIEEKTGKLTDEEYGTLLASMAITKLITEENYSATGAAVPSLDEFTFLALGGLAKSVVKGTLGKLIGKALIENADDVGNAAISYMKGKPVMPSEKILSDALNPASYAYRIAKKYGINLKGSSQPIQIIYDSNLPLGQYGVTKQVEGGLLMRLGPSAFSSESALANTIAHELNHCRAYLKGVAAAEKPAYAAGNALEGYIGGNR